MPITLRTRFINAYRLDREHAALSRRGAGLHRHELVHSALLRRCGVRQKRTLQEVLLVPWKVLLALIAPHDPEAGGPGRLVYLLGTQLEATLAGAC